nr:hypothetical protein BaRGS_013366 [Batillaria attramentaria]
MACVKMEGLACGSRQSSTGIWYKGLAAQSLKILPPGGSLAYDLTQSNEKLIVFTCTAPDQASAGTLEWFDKNDRPLTSGSGRVLVYTQGMSKILQISRPGDSDGGTYTCKGTVEGQETEASILLELYKGISNTSPLQQYPVQGTDAKIMCNVSSSMSFAVKWFTGDLVPIQTGDKFLQMTDHLLVKNIQLNDSGHYFCQCMIPNLGITQGYNISVTVTIPPKMDGPITQEPPTPKEGDDLELICVAEGTPAPSYMYYKGNVPVNDEPSTNGRLRLEKVTRDQEGIYTCIATNKGGEDRQDVRVDIRIPPKIDPIQNISMEANRECIMQCVAKGDPKPNLFWRRKDRQDYYTENPTEGEEIRVEEYSQTDDENEFTSITTTTLKLIIPTLKPEHSAEYVCKAENEAGMEEKAGRIDVQYAPNFSDQANAGTAFYGWIGGSTNLTCVANGNPEPVISWWYNNQEVQQGTDYTVIAGNSGVPTKAISYLIPSVRADTVDNVFGSYICRAVNKFNPSGEEQTLEFKQAMSNDEIITQTSVRDLEANTNYIIEVSAKSKVGLGIAEQIQGTTATVRQPEEVHVTSSREGSAANSYTLTWDVPLDGGADILSYRVEYAKADVDTTSDPWSLARAPAGYDKREVDNGQATSLALSGLDRDAYYHVKVVAINRIGESSPASFIFKTSSQGGEASVDSGSAPALGKGGILGIILVLLLLLLIAVDVALYKTKQCGIIWTICQALGRKDEGAATSSKSPEDGDEANAKLLGKEKEDSLKTENEVAKEAEPAVEAEPEAPQEKELEPEDKEEKPAEPVKAEEPAEPKAKTPTEPEPEAPKAEPAPETTPAVDTQPASDEKPDATANA